MGRRNFWSFIGMICSAAVLGQEFAGIPEQEWNIAENAAAKMINAVILQESGLLREREKDYLYEFYRRIKIFDEQGRSAATQEFEYDDDATKIVLIAGRTIRPNQTTLQLSERDIFTDKIVKKGKEELLQKKLIFPGVEDGCIIEYRIVQELKYPVFSWPFQNLYYTINSQYVFEPKDFLFDWRIINPGNSCVEVEFSPNRNDMKKITFTMKDVVPLETEELMPPENGLKTTLRLYPTFSRSYAYSTTAFGYNLFTFSVRPFATGLATYRFYEDKYWRELAEEWGEFWNVYSKESKFIPDIIAKVVIAQDSKQQKMKKLYTYVQENFTNHDLVDDEEEKKNFTIPEKIDDLIDERYGNSWLINGLYAMLLRGIDIPATPVYLDDRDEVVFNEQNFKRNFARSVVMADTANHKFVYLSPALAYLPFGQVPWYLQNVVGVAADYRPNNRSMTSEYLVRTSRDKSSIVNIDLIDATIVINADNSADVEVLNSFKGQQNWIFKSSNRHNSDDEIKKTVADKYDKKYKGAKIVSFIVDNRDSTDAFSALRYNIHIPDFAVAIGKRIAFKPCFLDPPIEKLAAVEKRKYPVCFDYPHQQICTIKIIPPEGYQLEFTPADINIVTSQSSFLAQVIHSGREITYKDIFKVDEIEIHPLHFDNIKKVADAVQNSYSQELMLAAAN